MKQFITLVLLSISLIGFSQESSTKKHEIGLSMYSLTNVAIYTSDADRYLKWLPNNTFVNGVSYKYHWKKTALRAGFNYVFYDFDNNFDPDKLVSEQLFSGNIWNVGGKIGVEHRFGNGKLQPYIAGDVFYQYGENSGVPWIVGCPTCDILYAATSTISNTAGFSPSVGLSYQFMKRFSLRIETSGDFGWYKQTVTTFKAVRNEGFFISYNPISTFSLNFHF